jgi:hypothetical protein
MAALSASARWRDFAATWTPVLGAGVAVGALAGAGQLGIGYGLGLLHYWLPARTELTGGVWASQLTWVAWFAALAVLAGAAAASRVAWRYEHPLDLGTRIAAAVAAGIGGAVVMPLTALPARSVAGPGGVDPAADAVLAAGLGLVVGALAAVAALTVRLVAVSVTLLVAAVWLLALVSAAPSLASTAELPDVRLAVLDLPALGDARSTLAVLSPPALALLICGAVAAAARSRGFPPLLTAVSSAAAPGLLALTYLIGSPGASDRAAQVSAYAGSLIALAAGLLVALLVGAVRLPSAGTAAEPGGDDQPTGLLPPVSAAPAEPASPETASLETAEPEPPSLETAEPEPPSLGTLEPPAWPEPPSPETAEPEPLSPEPPAWPAYTEPATAPERSEPLSTMSSLFPELRLPSASPSSFPESATEPPEPAEPPEPVSRAEFDTAADLFPSSEPDAASDAGDTAEPGAAATLAATSELPAVPPEPDRPSKRLRLPKLRRKPKPPKETTEPAAAEPVEPTSPAAPEPRPASTPPRPRRRRDVEHVDWISSLSDRSEEEEQPEKGRRRLRRDRDAGAAEDPLPDAPTWRASEDPDPDPPPIHRPYVSRPDRSGSDS